MEAKRMRFNANVLPNMHQIAQIPSPIEFKIWQNRQIEECIDDNFINSFLESTRERITQRQSIQGQMQHRRLEDQAINQAIDTIGLKKPSLLDDEDEEEEEESSSDSFENLLPSSHLNLSQNSSLEEFAIDSAIRSYGLHKKSI